MAVEQAEPAVPVEQAVQKVVLMVRSVVTPHPVRDSSRCFPLARVPTLHKKDQVPDKKIVRIPSTNTRFVP